MKTSYDCYLLACREAGLQPVSFWRFSIAYGKYQREFRKALDERMGCLPLPSKQRTRIVARWTRLVRLAELVERGRQISYLARHYNDGKDEPGSAASGAREPRTPLTPVLVGCASRPMPTDDALKDAYSWRV